jgi:hypothetical protein
MPWYLPILCLWLLATSAFAVDPIQLPPARYDQPFDGPVKVFARDWNTIEATCGRGRYGCSRIKDGECQVMVPITGIGGVAERAAELIRRHEIGHCNGWPQDHRR